MRCAGCRKVVVELSEMTSAEAHAFLDRRRDECVSLRVNERDEVILRDVPEEPIVARVAANARPMIFVAAMMAAACGPGATSSGGADAHAVVADAAGSAEIETVAIDAGPVAVDSDAGTAKGDAGAVAHPARRPMRKLGGIPPARKPEVLGGY